MSSKNAPLRIGLIAAPGLSTCTVSVATDDDAAESSAGAVEAICAAARGARDTARAIPQAKVADRRRADRRVRGLFIGTGKVSGREAARNLTRHRSGSRK